MLHKGDTDSGHRFKTHPESVNFVVRDPDLQAALETRHTQTFTVTVVAHGFSSHLLPSDPYLAATSTVQGSSTINLGTRAVSDTALIGSTSSTMASFQS